MRRWLAAVVLGTLLLGTLAPPAHAGGAAYDVFLALSAFALFTNLVLAPLLARPVYAAPPAVVYLGAPAVSATPVGGPAPGAAAGGWSPPPSGATTELVVSPHGRYVLQGDGVTVTYHWMWVPAPPRGTPPAPPPR
jgi:hypothetical protein